MRNLNYWLKATNGDQLPYLDEIQFFVINDAKKSGPMRCAPAMVDLIATSDGSNINSFDGDGDYPTELAGAVRRDRRHHVPPVTCRARRLGVVVRASTGASTSRP